METEISQKTPQVVKPSAFACVTLVPINVSYVNPRFWLFYCDKVPDGPVFAEITAME
jgi:hypothetical protein